MLDLLAGLQARRAPALLIELAEAYGVSVKQLRRDIAALGVAGHAVEIVRVEGRSAARLVRGRGATLALSLRERFALLAMRDVFAALDGTADAVDELLSGALQRRTVDTRYRPAHGKGLRGGFEPWALALYRNGLYAVGRWEAELGPRVFAVERFTSVTRRRRGARFEIPAGFSLDAFFGGALGVFPGGEPEKVVLVFARGVGTVVTSRRWHATQTTQPLPDGRVRLELVAAISPEVVSWLVGWGSPCGSWGRRRCATPSRRSTSRRFQWSSAPARETGRRPAAAAIITRSSRHDQRAHMRIWATIRPRLSPPRPWTISLCPRCRCRP